MDSLAGFKKRKTLEAALYGCTVYVIKSWISTSWFVYQKFECSLNSKNLDSNVQLTGPANCL